MTYATIEKSIYRKLVQKYREERSNRYSEWETWYGADSENKWVRADDSNLFTATGRINPPPKYEYEGIVARSSEEKARVWKKIVDSSWQTGADTPAAYTVNDDYWDSLSLAYTEWKSQKKVAKANPRTEKQRKLRSNLLIKVRSRHDPLRQDCSPQELQARLLLRDLLTEAEWRRYVTNGFLMVKGKSGKWYQIFADQRKTVVYENGNATHRLCIHTTAECPPTDHIINLKTMIEIDEQLVWNGSNVSRVSPLIYAA